MQAIPWFDDSIGLVAALGGSLSDGDEEEMGRVAQSLDAPDALLRIDPEKTLDGFRARLLYWDTSRPGRPVLDLEFNLEEDGVLRSLVARPAGSRP